MSNVREVDLLARAILDVNFALRPAAGPPLKEIEVVALAAGAIGELERKGLTVSITWKFWKRSSAPETDARLAVLAFLDLEDEALRELIYDAVEETNFGQAAPIGRAVIAALRAVAQGETTE